MTQMELFLRLERLNTKQLHRFTQLCNAGIAPSKAVEVVEGIE